MGALRERMLREMQLRRLSASTQKAYLAAIVGLTKHYRVSPDASDGERVQQYLLHLMQERQLEWSSVNVIASGIRFFYTETLKQPEVPLGIPPRRTPRHLPEILSAEELERLLASPENPKHRALLRTTYAAGLRVSEVVCVKVADLDSDRMMIRVADGKGEKDR